LDQLRAGANFAALAQQFSQGSLASNGGDLGWVAAGQSRPEIEAALAEMTVGSYSQPIEAVGAIHILQLRDKRSILAEQNDPRVRLEQVLLPAGRDGARERAIEIQNTVEGCDALGEAAEKAGVANSSDIGWVRLGDLPEALHDAVADLEIGQPSAPTETGAGLHVLMICERGDTSGGEQQRQAIRDRIERERLEVLSRSLLRNLQRSAFVDLRI
jgi:peptidyl-prolyl cis-trans isomerase SurA